MGIIHLYGKYIHIQDELWTKLKYDYQRHVCAGFLCFYKDILDLELIDKLLFKIDNFCRGINSFIELFNWCIAQNVYSVIFKKNSDKYDISFFEPDKYQDNKTFRPNPVFRHYWASNCLCDEYFNDAKRVINELK